MYVAAILKRAEVEEEEQEEIEKHLKSLAGTALDLADSRLLLVVRFH